MSNSLTDLNNFSNQPIVFNDDRPYVIEFDRAAPDDPSIAVEEDIEFVHPVGINIVNINSVPNPIAYTIDLSDFGADAIFSWPVPIPQNLSYVISGPSGSIHTLIGLIWPEVWELIKNPRILIKDRGENFSYTSTISYPDPTSPDDYLDLTWTVNATVTESPELSEPVTWTYIKNSPGTIDGVPLIVDAYTGPGEYRIVITPSVTVAVESMSTSGSSAAGVNFDNVTKVLSIEGSKDDVNSHLQSIFFTPADGVTQSFTLSYFLINPISNVTTTKTQNIEAADLAFNISRVSYNEDTPVPFVYTIVDESPTASSFTVSITQNQPSISTNPGYFEFNGSNVGTTVTWTGNRQQISQANLVYVPPIDWDQTISLAVTQSKIDDGQLVLQHDGDLWNLQNVETNPEVINLSNRPFFGNTFNANLFASSAVTITDGPDIGQTYTVTLSSPGGKFGNTIETAFAAGNTYTITGNVTVCNQQLTQVGFLPNRGIDSDTTYTYTQSRDNRSQVNQQLTLTFSGSDPIPGETIEIFSNTSITISPIVGIFGNVAVYSCGGGGGGAGAGSPSIGNIFGGGGGGGWLAVANISGPGITNFGTANVVVGNGGAGNMVVGNSAVGQSGQNSYIEIAGNIFANAPGGSGGIASTVPGQSKGGNSGRNLFGNVTVTVGGNSWPDGLKSGGGGASPDGNGYNATKFAGAFRQDAFQTSGTIFPFIETSPFPEIRSDYRSRRMFGPGGGASQRTGIGSGIRSTTAGWSDGQPAWRIPHAAAGGGGAGGYYNSPSVLLDFIFPSPVEPNTQFGTGEGAPGMVIIKIQ